MPCDTRPNLTEEAKANQRDALARLQAALGAGSASIVISRQGAVAFNGWADAERAGLSDLCAFRRLANAPELRKALARAEAKAGMKLDRRMLAAGVHSHDGGATWHGGH